MDILKKILRPQVLIPAVLSIALVAALLAFGDFHQVIHNLESFNRLYLIWLLLVFAAYEAVRGWQWVYLLRKVGIKASLRAEIFAFLGSEITKSIPIGNYFQNYLLERSDGADVGVTSAVTTFQILGEVAASLAGLIILGLGAWSWYIRGIIIGGLLLFGLSIWLYVKFHGATEAPQWMHRHKATETFLKEFKNFREASKDMLHPRTLIIAFINSAVYLILGGAALYLTARGLGVNNLTLWSALAVYFFSLAISLIIPLPTDIGATELTGTGAFLLVGVGKSSAVSTMLIFRFLSIIAAVLFAGAGAAILHEEVTAVIHEEGHADEGQDDEKDEDEDENKSERRVQRQEEHQPVAKSTGEESADTELVLPFAVSRASQVEQVEAAARPTGATITPAAAAHPSYSDQDTRDQEANGTATRTPGG